MKAAIIIPARYKSTRFPGKPLAILNGKSMISRVYDICQEVCENTYVATDDSKIENHCNENGMKVLMTDESCLTGTDRVYQASLQIDAEILINVQGDEPLIDPEDIKAVLDEGRKYSEDIINAMCPISNESDFFSTTVPKVVTLPNKELLYMSRAGIPANKKLDFVKGKRQVCIYSLPKKALKDFYDHGKKTELEEQEDIEILRFLELGYKVRMIDVNGESLAVDTPEDQTRVDLILREKEGLCD